MADSYQFHLARWNERDKHLKCPGCGRAKGCFKEYVDANGNPVDCEGHTVGKCDHETSCGYHLTPKEWFKAGGKVDLTAIKKDEREVKRIEIDPKLVGQFYDHTKAVSNTFLKWVDTLPLTDEQRQCLPYLTMMYAIGTTSDGRIIWWQIDESRKVRTGKIMAYDNTGHRLKDAEGNSVGFSWVHSMMAKKFGMYKETDKHRYELHQCLFGQHLLPIAPDAEVHIVESEKTAFIMSVLDQDAMSKHIWLATGGLYNLNKSKLQPMRNRRVYCYPDANGIDKWKEAIKGTNAKLATIWMQQINEADGKGADIADVLIRKLQVNEPTSKQLNADDLPPITYPTLIENTLINNPIVQHCIKLFDLR